MDVRKPCIDGFLKPQIIDNSNICGDFNFESFLLKLNISTGRHILPGSINTQANFDSDAAVIKSVVPQWLNSRYLVKLDMWTSKSLGIEFTDFKTIPILLKQYWYRMSGYQIIYRHDLISRRKEVQIMKQPSYRNMPFDT